MASLKSASSLQPASYYAGLLSNPHVKTALEAIAVAEGTKKAVNPYGTHFGYKSFSSFDDHPREVVTVGRYSSTAAGKYQALAGSWDEVSRAIGLKDFTPKSQDIFAVARMDQRAMSEDKTVLDEVLSGNVKEALKSKAAGEEWASLPASPYGQPTINNSKLESIVDDVFSSFVAGPKAPIDMAQPAPLPPGVVATPTSITAGIPAPVESPVKEALDKIASVPDLSVSELSAQFTPTQIASVNDIVSANINPSGLAKGLPQSATTAPDFAATPAVNPSVGMQSFDPSAVAEIAAPPTVSTTFSNQPAMSVDPGLVAAVAQQAAQPSTEAKDYGFQDIAPVAPSASTATDEAVVSSAQTTPTATEEAISSVNQDLDTALSEARSEFSAAAEAAQDPSMGDLENVAPSEIAGVPASELDAVDIPGTARADQLPDMAALEQITQDDAEIAAVAPQEVAPQATPEIEAINPQSGLTPSKEKALDQEIDKLSELGATTAPQTGKGNILGGLLETITGIANPGAFSGMMGFTAKDPIEAVNSNLKGGVEAARKSVSPAGTATFGGQSANFNGMDAFVGPTGITTVMDDNMSFIDNSGSLGSKFGAVGQSIDGGMGKAQNALGGFLGSIMGALGKGIEAVNPNDPTSNTEQSASADISAPSQSAPGGGGGALGGMGIGGMQEDRDQYSGGEASYGGSGNQGGAGGGSGGGETYLCSVAYEYGWIDAETLAADFIAGQSVPDGVYNFYSMWAPQLADACRKNRVLRGALMPLVTVWAKSMAWAFAAKYATK